MTFAELVDLCIAARAEALSREQNLPEAERERAAMASVLRVASARSPGIARWLEGQQPATVVDELEPKRLRARAWPTIEAVAAEASAATGGDVTPELLTGPCSYPWLVPWRDLCWWRLSRQGMRTRQIAQVFRRHWTRVAEGVRRCDARVRSGEAREATGA